MSGPGQPPDPAADADGNLPARRGEERLNEQVVGRGMFGVQGTPDTSGYGTLRVYQGPPRHSERPLVASTRRWATPES